MRLSEHHKNLDENGIGKCSMPMWKNGFPNGFCNRPAYGETVDERDPRACFLGLMCPSHGGPETLVFKDGDQWCAVYPDFVNLQESLAGFGPTPEGAREALAAIAKAERIE